MNLLFVVALVLLFMQATSIRTHKECFQKEKTLAVLEVAQDSIFKLKDFLPECDGDSNKTACGKKEKAEAYIEAALLLIEEARKHYPNCNLDETREPKPETTPIPEPETQPTPEPEPLPTDCLDVKRGGKTVSGVYSVQLARPEAKNKKMDVFCDMKTDGGGWTVIQRRDNYTVQEDFFRNWIDYKTGFGNIMKDFWIGNENIYYLSNVGQSEIRFDMQSQDLESRYARYSSFRTEGEGNQYKLHISGYSGNAGDALENNNQMRFYTKDRDNGNFFVRLSCATERKGGWWWNRCGKCNLNGLYSRTKACDNYKHLYYYDWKECEPLKFTEIKVRRRL